MTKLVACAFPFSIASLDFCLIQLIFLNLEVVFFLLGSMIFILGLGKPFRYSGSYICLLFFVLFPLSFWVLIALFLSFFLNAAFL
jgi:hypothetical protein